MPSLVLPPLRLPLNSPDAVIVSPESDAYQAVARAAAAGISKLTGRTPRIVSDSVPPVEIGTGPVLVLGNLMDSGLARLLYLGAYDFTDYSWPSPGGHVIRTIRDPFGAGANVIVLGGSDVQGVSDAADALLSVVEQRGPEIGYLNQVKLGCWSAEIRSYTQELLGADDRVWHRAGVSGSWDYQIQIAQTGIGYLRTGDEAYLPVFKRELRYWFDHDVYHPKGDAPQMLHGFLNTILLVWDLIRDHPIFTEKERRRFDQDFLWVFRSGEGPGRIDAASRREVIRDNHGTRTGLDAVFGGRYFLRRFGLADGQRWLEIAERYFATQMSSAKPVEDSWGHQWAASLYNTAVYAMATGKDEYFQSEAFGLAADRALIAHSTGGGPFGYLAACAAAAANTAYLSGWQSGEGLGKHCAAMKGHGDEYLRSFCTGLPVKNRDDLRGVAIAPVDELWYDTIDAAGFNPGGLFVVTPGREKCFDKISIREGWERDDFYLLFDGISGGHHAFQDGNCIVGFHEGGLSWLTSQHSGNTSATVRAQNGVFVSLDGAGAGRLHRYARLLYAGTTGGYLAAAGALEDVGDVDWQRHILRKRGRWTLVIDRATVKRSGEVLAERHWHLRGEVTPRPHGLVCQQSWRGQPRSLHLASAGLEPGGMSGTNHRVEIVRANATQDQPLELAALLYVNSDPDKTEFRLTQTQAGWRVDGPDGAEFVTVGIAGARISVASERGTAAVGVETTAPVPSHAQALAAEPVPPAAMLPLRPKARQVSLRWHEVRVGRAPVSAVAIANDGRIAAGDTDGKVAVFGPARRKTGQADLRSKVLSLHFLGEDLLVGEDRGVLTRLAADGSQRWQVVIPYVPMAWPYWSEEKSRVRETTSADIDGDGEEEILIANSDRRVYAFAADAKELWQAPVEWGVYTAMTVGQHQGKFALLGGASQPAMHGWCIVYGGDGKLLTRFRRPDLVSWSIPCQFRDMRIADIDGDGRPEIVNAIDTNCRQLVVYREDGKVLWDADVAGAAEAVVVGPSTGHNGPAVVYCSSASGYVSAFDGRTGTRRWACFLGERTKLVAPYGRGRVVAIAPSGRAYLVSVTGDLLGCHDLRSEVTGLLRPGDHRAGNTVLLGTRDGRSVLLAEPQ